VVSEAAANLLRRQVITAVSVSEAENRPISEERIVDMTDFPKTDVVQELARLKTEGIVGFWGTPVDVAGSPIKRAEAGWTLLKPPAPSS